jgi:hypothetical protein
MASRSTSLRSLIERLEDLAQDYGDDTQVLVATQPTYPLTQLITAVAQPDVGDDGDPLHPEVEDKPTVWILTDSPDSGCGISPYAPTSLWDGDAWV